ncbi:MAG TPA: type IX secretion system membrane protein PorP/SprF [Bacteroidales bacterium]|nr:type IX secretion system membrane protein PorP/SprF [Bacteroidales bacterium]
MGAATLKAQQELIFTHYLHNPVSINPAIAGTVRNLNMSMLSCLQWVGLEGAPTTFSYSAHMPCPDKKKNWSWTKPYER